MTASEFGDFIDSSEAASATEKAAHKRKGRKKR